ncbi:MAG: 50S ribosomal protein L11 methyltransferase [Hyphomicrobiales bacterium]|nr:50S ribosomal protein L11 methyltransferase [Hyphomicrobiales bacterium]
MPQVKLSVAAASADHARTLEALLNELAEPAPLAVTRFEAGADRYVVEGYFEADVNVSAIVDALSASGAAAGPVEQERVEDLNWVSISQAALPPVIAGRFVVHGSHDAGRIGRRAGAILIDAGEAFGTAHHATTHQCLLALEAVARRRAYRDVLDLGCGSGVLAIAAARLLPLATIIASDIDPVAVDVARANAARNGVGARVRLVVATGFEHAAMRREGAFDLVVANILAGPLIAVAPRMRRALDAGGTAILSGLLQSQVRPVVAAYQAAGFKLDACRVSAGWAALTLTRL